MTKYISKIRVVRLSIIIILQAFLTTSILIYAEPVDKGKVGSPPTYPSQFPKKEITQLVLSDEPTVTMIGKEEAKISFETAMPCPAVRIYYGVYEPDQTLPLPRYRHAAKENLNEKSTKHSVTINIKRLFHPAFDISGFSENEGGVVAYRIEIYNPKTAAACFYDRRFAFRGPEVVPTVIEGPFVDQITPTSAVISWKTDMPVICRLFVDKQVLTTINDIPETRFELKVNLKSGTKHTYRIKFVKEKHASSTRSYFFHTPEHKASSFSFAIMGDSRESYGGGENAFNGVNYKALEQLTIAAYNRGAEFIIHTGDLINGHTTSNLDFVMQLGSYKRTVEAVGHYIPIYETMGNHEVLMDVFDNGSGYGIRFDKSGQHSSESIFAREFVNPKNGPEPEVEGAPAYKENVYYFDYGNCRFVIMNNTYWWSNYPEQYGGNREGYVLDDQTKWLKQTFIDTKNNTAIEHLFLIAHEPMFPNSVHIKDAMWYNGGDPLKNNGIDRTYVVQRRDEIWQAFVATDKAVLAVSSHEHMYCRTCITPEINPDYKHSVWQIITGGAGAPYYNLKTNVPWASYVEAFSTQMHYVLIKVYENVVNLEVYTITGELIDEMVLVE